MKESSFGIIPLHHSRSGWKVLLVQHGVGGHWAFPKGHAEAGETPQETACRELQEETGLSVIRFISEIPLIEEYSFRRQGKLINKHVTYFVAEVTTASLLLQEEEISDSQWVPVEAVGDYVTFPAAKALCTQLISLLMDLGEE